MVICNDDIDAPSAHIVDEVNVNETEFPTVSHNNLEDPSSPTNQAFDTCVANDCDPIDQLHPTNDEAPSLYSFPDGSSFEIGQNFVSKEELKNKLYEAAINNYWKMKIVKSDTSLYVVKCVDDDSQWRLWAAKISMSEFFSIRTYIITHTCGIEKQKKKHSQATAAVVADMVKTRYGGDIHHTPTPKSIIGMMNTLRA